ncbi:MAG: hypothetical protein ING75_00905 [Rhodocyclaceae bacterium]|nr:hypothetical protein [Rhodocyclaceae bacterium]
MNIAKHGITAETAGAFQNAVGQLKDSAKNAAASVAGANGAAVVGFVTDQVTARFEDGATVIKATATGAAYIGLKIAGNEGAAQLASDALLESRGEVAGAALATVTGGGSRNARQVARATEREVVKRAESTLKPGPYAKESIPGHMGKPTAAEQQKVNALMKDNGCHTCGTKTAGTKSGNAVVDHQPPQALDQTKQFLPHCITCMRRQGGEVRQELFKRNTE